MMGLFDKKISEPVLSIVQAMQEDKFEFSSKDGVWTLKLKDYDMKLQFWAGRMMNGGCWTADEQYLMCKAAKECYDKHTVNINSTVRKQWYNALKGELDVRN